MPTRPCRFCLAMQDDSVFADFDVDDDRCLHLVRISFDGYGCCHTAENVRSMSSATSREFIALVEAGNVASGDLSRILSKYFRDNSDVIWKDALEDHKLLSD